MKLKSLFLIPTCVLLLTACGPNLEDAQKLGFESVEQMKKLQADGFKTMDEFNVAESKRLGFEDVAEMKQLQAEGYKSKSDWELAESKRLGFDNVNEYKDGINIGFVDGKIYELKKKYGFKDYQLFTEYKNSNAEGRIRISIMNYQSIYSKEHAIECIGILAVHKEIAAEYYTAKRSKAFISDLITFIGLYANILKAYGLSDDEVAKGMIDSGGAMYTEYVKNINSNKISNDELSNFVKAKGADLNRCTSEVGQIFGEKFILNY